MCKIGYFEVEPGRMALGIAVDPHREVILEGIDQNSKVQVATLKIGVELQVVVSESWVHPCEQSILHGSNREDLLLLSPESKRILREDLSVHLMLILQILLSIDSEGFEIGDMPWPHVDDPVGLSGAEGGQTFGEQIDLRIGKVNRELFERMLS